jgi:hypothetical protein
MPVGLVTEVCDALGVSLPTDRASLEALVQAWSARVPFDPVAKMAALRHGTMPPGDDPVVVVQRWLTTGLGSTCWGHTTALAAILDRAEVPTSIGVDRMLTDDLVDFHSFLLATVDGERFLIDPIHPSGSLLAFVPGAVGDHPDYQVGIEHAGGRIVHWFGPAEDRHRYVALATDLDLADVRAFLTISVQHSGVRSRFFLRRVLPDAVVQIRPTDDGTGLTRSVGGVEPEPLGAMAAGADCEVGTLRATEVGRTLAAIGLHPEADAMLRLAGLVDPSSPAPWLASDPAR